MRGKEMRREGNRRRGEREGSVSISFPGVCIKGRAREGRKEKGRLEGFRGGAMLALCLLTYIGPLKSASLLFCSALLSRATDDCPLFALLTFVSFSHFPSVFIFSSTLLETQLKHLQDNETTEASAGCDGISSYCLFRLIDQHFKLVNLCIVFRCDLFPLL